MSGSKKREAERQAQEQRRAAERQAEQERQAAEAARQAQRAREHQIQQLKDEILKMAETAVARVKLHRSQINGLVQVLGNEGKFVASAELVELRAQKPVNFKRIGLNLNVQLPPASEAVDSGEFDVTSTTKAVFTGRTQNRTWDFAKIVNLDTSGTDTVLINVSNRQKVSGVQYANGLDVILDFGLRYVLDKFRGEDVTWAEPEIEDRRQQADVYYDTAKAAVDAKLDELRKMVGDVAEFSRTLPELPAKP